MKTNWQSLVLYAGLLFTAALAPAANYELRSVTIGNGGGTSSGGSYAFSDTLGQPVLGSVSGGSFSLQLGALHPAALSPVGSNLDLTLAASQSSVVVTENFTAPFTLSVSNRGSDAAAGVHLAVQLPAGVFVQSITNSAGACQVTASNVTCSVPHLASQGTVAIELTLRARFLPEQSNEFEHLGDLTCVVSATEIDPNPLDNARTLPVTVWQQLDWGDARDGFPVSLAENGARHRFWPGHRLGLLWDRQTDGFHSASADWDDTHGGSPDDEDGVVFLTPLVPGTLASVMVTSSFAGFLDAWADFNDDAHWAGAVEQLFPTSQPLVPGMNTFTFTVPPGASAGMITTRWRASTTGGLSDTGYGGKGEVEDHLVEVQAAPGLPDVNVVFQNLPATAVAGQPLSYSVVVSNVSSVTATGLTVVVTHLGSIGAVPGVTTDEGSCEVVNDEVRCIMGSLSTGRSARVHVTVTPGLQESFRIGARADLAILDSNPLDNLASRRLVVVPWFPQQCFCSCFTNVPSPSPDPLLTSWFTDGSGQYAQVRLVTGGPLKTDWTGGNTVAGTARSVDTVYADIQKIQSTPSFAYVSAYGLASHVMGPWYCDTMTFPNKPLDLTQITRIPRQPIANSAHPVTPLGSMGVWVNGTAVYNMLDGYFYQGTTGLDINPPGTRGIWNRDAYFSEKVTFDPALFHSQQDGEYHAHNSPTLLRWQLNDNVTAETNLDGAVRYVEATNHFQHSPILGWAFDGHPIYGPYGYSDPMNTNSGIGRMRSGYVLRDGDYGTTDLRATGRHSLPAWTRCADANHTQIGSTNDHGPDPVGIDTTGVCNEIAWDLGRYVEDYAYLGDIWGNPSAGVNWDLDRYNGRCCKTPEFPDGTYAYFVTLDTNGVPAFPYIIGWQYCSETNGGVVASVPTDATTHFSAAQPQLHAPAASSPFRLNEPFTLQWSSREGGTYRVWASDDLQTWSVISPPLPSGGTTTSYTNPPSLTPQTFRAFKLQLESDGGGRP